LFSASAFVFDVPVLFNKNRHRILVKVPH